MLKRDGLRLVFVTENKHKLAEASSILSKWNITLYMESVPKIELQSDSLENISRYAALYAYNNIKKPLVVEDSGLFIDSLNGFPGPYSSFVYKKIGLRGILKLLEESRERDAFFKTALTCVCPPYVQTFTGIVRGKISLEPKGSEGFGYDPIFIPEGHDKTFAELGVSLKNRISHRAKAFESLGKWIARTFYLMRNL